MTDERADELSRAARLRAARLSAGKTQAQIAKAAGISQATYANIEQGRTKIPPAVYFVMERDHVARFRDIYVGETQTSHCTEFLQDDLVLDCVARGLRAMVLAGVPLVEPDLVVKIEAGIAVSIRLAVQRIVGPSHWRRPIPAAASIAGDGL